ncbi:MAG: response regulator [Desulfovibrio sp.]|nr:response regulator [Desulfovibrio sp.]
MTSVSAKSPEASRERRTVLTAAALLCSAILIAVFFSFWSFTRLIEDQTRDQAIQMAHLSISKDLYLRAWVASLGGIYATVTPQTMPNPWLSPENRDFTLPNGQQITRINPAYAYRLVQQFWQKGSSGRGRLVGLEPLRPENMADHWEERALRELMASGGLEKQEEQKVDGRPRIRLLRVLRAEKDCLRCHAVRGFKEGEVLGGLSVIPPLDQVSEDYRILGNKIVLLHFLVAPLCLAVVCFFTVRTLRSIRQRDAAIRQMEEQLEYREQQVEERTSQLRASEQASLRLLNATTDAIIGLGSDETITFVNKACISLLGYQESELLGRDIVAALRPLRSDGSLLPKEECTVCKALRSGRSVHLDLKRFSHKDGHAVMIRGSLAIVTEDGKATGGILAFQDVGAAYIAEMRQKVFFHQAREIFFILNADRQIVDCNPAALAWLGLSSREELVGNPYRILPEQQEDGVPTREALNNLFYICDREGRVRFTWLFRRADGRDLPCEGSLVRQESPLGTVYFAALHDQEAIRAYERQINNERALLQDVMERAPACMLVCDEAHRVLACNSGTKQKLNVDTDSNCRSIWEDVMGFVRLSAQIWQGQSFYKVPVRVWDALDQNQRYHMLLTACLISYRNSPAILLWLQDVTEITMLRLAAEASARSKSVFLAQMSHEIRTPLNAIIGMSQIAAENVHDIEKTSHALDQILVSSRHLLGILNDILDISKIEHGKMRLELAPGRIACIYEDVDPIIRNSCDAKQICYNRQINVLSDVHIVYDRLRLNQVIINLLGNAVKFTSAGGRVSFDLQVAAQGTRSITLAFCISDTGIGMSQEQVDRLFMPFEQADNSISRRFGGTGLGLAISQNLVRLMGGEIRVESRLGEGSTFSFELTFEKAAAEGEDAEEESLDSLDLHGRRILLVEDVPINREIVREVLSATGAEVTEAGDGVEALEIFHTSGEGYFSLIFMDIQMPRMDGYEASRLIRAMPGAYAAKIPIVAMTANAFNDDVEDALASGMTAHLAKPLDFAQLYRMLERHILKKEG